MKTEEVNILIAKYIGSKIDKKSYSYWRYQIKDGRYSYAHQLNYHLSWDWLHPVYIKITHIGLFMMTNGFDKLWLEKSKDIDRAMLNEDTPLRAAILIADLIQWYNQSQINEPKPEVSDTTMSNQGIKAK